jgi:Tol biopolymer transport system component
LAVLATAHLTFVARDAAAQHAGHGVMYHFPRWSPDGTTIVVSSTADGDSEIYLLRLGGEEPLKLTDNSGFDDAARWSEDGRRIVFQTDRRGTRELYSMAADGSDQVPFTGPPPVATSPDGRTRLVESEIDGRWFIVAEHADGTKHILTSGPHAEQPSFSPSGEQIVYEQRSADAPDDIARSNVVVANADGSHPRVVSSGTDPSWSPDGTTLLFKIWVDPEDAPGEGGQPWIATASPDGKTITRLTPGVHPHWSPDGRRIVYMADAGERTDIWVMNADGAEKVCLTCGS